MCVRVLYLQGAVYVTFQTANYVVVMTRRVYTVYNTRADREEVAEDIILLPYRVQSVPTIELRTF